MGFNWRLVEQELFNPRFGGMSATELRKVLFAVCPSGADEKMAADNYRLGRMLGLTARQVTNLKVGANLLLETEEKNEMTAKEYFKSFLEAGHMEYQPSKNRIAIQVEDPIAFNYLSSSLSSSGVFRKCDASTVASNLVPCIQLGLKTFGVVA